jgi:phospholipid/cholesterol/gamma-HCH transport system ATP-binding protein
MSEAPSSPLPEQHSVNVSIRGLRKGYGGVPVLKGINLEIQRGEIFVIMGPSGSGKSVLLRHIVGLEPPDEGDIQIEGESIQTAGVMDRHRMALVFQSGALLNSLNVLENVGLYLSEHRLKKPAEIARVATEKLEMLGLKNVRDKYPSELSGGMKKRVSIARALVIEPQLILYDEPTSELDPLSAVVIGEEILSLSRRINVTSIVVTHDRDLAFGIADRIAMMHEGTIIAVGTVDEIKLNRHPVIHRFLHIDFKPNHNPLSS